MSRLPKLALFAALSAIPGCDCDGGSGGPDANPDASPITFAECDSDTAAWVRNSYLAIVGHRPHGQAEVDVYVQLHDQIAALVAAEESTLDPKEVVAQAMIQEPAYRDRWTSHFIDALRVPRTDEQDMASCYDDQIAGSPGSDLAGFVRDNPPTTTRPQFTMLDLVASSVALDDVTPIYLGHLFALVSFPIPAANVPPVEAELARREDFGAVFDSAYLNRDLVCLQCHNSETSVTDSLTPEVDRHWPLPGLYEQSLYGASSGLEHARAHAVFRFDGFAASAFGGDGPRRPWGWSSGCGSFYNNVGDDPAAIDGQFGDLAGRRLTVYDLEGSLRDGFDALRGSAISPGDGGVIEDPNQAFAYLTAATIVEGVWREVVGSGLTIANYFPRNEASRDLLKQLTDRFIASSYSLQDLLTAIVSSDYFSRQLPEQACGDSAYNYPNVFDPWVISDDDEARRLNGPGDSIAAISARTLMRSAYAAMEWQVPDAINFPASGGEGGFCEGLSCGQLQDACQMNFCCTTYNNQCLGGGGGGFGDELGFQQGVGAFIKNGERGFRGLDFQARLVWEDRFGACVNPAGSPDFIDELVVAAQADSTATVQDVVVAVKDRLLGEPTVDTGAEATALAALLGGALDRPASGVADLENRIRAMCGVLLSSPQFVLSGAAGTGGDAPRLTPTEWAFDAVCGDVAPRVADADGSGLAVVCADGALTLTVTPVTPPP